MHCEPQLLMYDEPEPIAPAPKNRSTPKQKPRNTGLFSHLQQFFVTSHLKLARPLQ
jgi:hypothetical protein